MRLSAAIVGGLLSGACSLLTPLDDLHGAGSGSIAWVQGREVDDYGSPEALRTTSVVLSNVAAHHALVVGVVALQSGAPVDTITISDDRGDTFTPTGAVLSYDDWVNVVIAVAFDVAGGTSIVTVDSAGTAVETNDVFALEYSGISAFDAASSGSGHTAGTDGAIADPVATTGATELLVALMYTDGTASAGTDFTNRNTSGGDSSLIEDRIVSPAGTYGATATMGGSGFYWVMTMGAFK